MRLENMANALDAEPVQLLVPSSELLAETDARLSFLSLAFSSCFMDLTLELKSLQRPNLRKGAKSSIQSLPSKVTPSMWG